MRFFLIDKITEWHVGTSAEAIKNMALSEDFFDDHFPRRPVMPGVLILEGMAQLSGLLLEAGLREKYGKDAKAVLTVLERTKFRDRVRPGDTLTYRSRVAAFGEDDPLGLETWGGAGPVGNIHCGGKDVSHWPDPVSVV
ncbi:MAG TPA: 3-hydroxyacyl-ACP dehydratase FabZ family protein [Phycisphaerae bacterium]|nr:3-hydroxyacyl-ACP dehydratase FabZ family protein [Phycisphaerae bacterium]